MSFKITKQGKTFVKKRTQTKNEVFWELFYIKEENTVGCNYYYHYKLISFPIGRKRKANFRNQSL